jgi:tetratricopeptide (TPR) repeat protein
MSYSGNPSLAADVKQRILSTFDQTVELAREGNRQEALLGCDFVLRMDPQFQPAHILQERLRAGDGPVRVDDLRGAPAVEAVPDDPFADLDPLSLGLPDQLPDDNASFLRDELQTLLEQRRFQDLLATAEREQSTIALHPELRRIVGAAQERLEAEPYVLKFLESARQAQQAGQDGEAGRLLDKARALDADHPGIAALEHKRSASVAPPPPIELPSPFPTTTMPVSLDFMVGDSESDRRIQELLAEGQTAFDAGDPQSAIDAWSRIFLIDIDHQEASRRIEAARKLKAESERQVEEIFHDGLAKLEAGDPAAARQAFQRVLEIQPGYFAAREYLQQLDAGTLPAPKATGARDAAPAAAEPARAFPSETRIPSQELKEEILVPPEPGEQPVQAPERPAKRMVAARDGSRARRLFFLIGGAVLVLALVGGWFAYQNWDRLFPNSQEEAPLSTLSQDPIARAERLHRAGKTAIALHQLRRIPPADPHYAQAQKLIAEWGGAPVAGTPAPPPAGQAPAQPPVAVSPENERRRLLLAAARQAYAETSYLKALRRLEQAGSIARLEGEDAQLLADTRKRLAPLAKEIEYFRQREWEYILRELWLKHDNDPSNRDVTQLLVDSSYNLAVRDLQRNDATKAAAWLADAVKLDPNDDVLRRHYLFAQTYEQRPKDLLYKIYVKYLPFR